MTTARAPTLEDLDLESLETEVGRAEAALEQDLVKAKRTTEVAQTHLATIKAQIAEASLAGAGKAVEGLRLALRERRAPALDAAAGRASLRDARLAAIEHRRKACAVVRASLEEFTSTTDQFETDLQRDAAALKAAVARAAAVPAPAPAAAPPRRVAPAPPSPPPSTRRASERLSLQIDIDFGSDSNFFSGFSTDISEGGLFLASVMHPKRGSVIDLRFSLPGDRTIQARGVVRWTREINDATPDVLPGAGIQFTDLAPEAAAAIHEFLAKRDPIFYVEE